MRLPAVALAAILAVAAFGREGASGSVSTNATPFAPILIRAGDVPGVTGHVQGMCSPLYFTLYADAVGLYLPSMIACAVIR